MKKRGIIIGDMHCGHLAGLTPPSYMDRIVEGSTTKHNKWAILQKELWERFATLLKKHAPYHFGIYMGDGIDGSGKRSGGTELLRTDVNKQVDIAVTVCNEVRRYKARRFKWAGVYGTPYHVGNNVDNEDNLAFKAGFYKIGSHEWIDINGCIIDIKHFIPTSQIESSRQTALSKEHVNNILWYEQGLVPKANVILRAHGHYNRGAFGPDWIAMICPALQGMGSKFGSRYCSGLVDWGISILDVDTKGRYDLFADTIIIDAQKAKVIKL